MLALYFSLVVLFDSHICRLYWCFIMSLNEINKVMMVMMMN